MEHEITRDHLKDRGTSRRKQDRAHKGRSGLRLSCSGWRVGMARWTRAAVESLNQELGGRDDSWIEPRRMRRQRS
jgi:hypothetical protein